MFAKISFVNRRYHVYYDDLSIHVFGNINALMVQRRRFGTGIPMIISATMNVPSTQHRMFYDDYSMHVFGTTNGLMGQLGTSCAFDSPGLARNEPTLGKHPQGDSTPSVLSFF